MPSEEIAVFDLGGTWFRWGRYAPSVGLLAPDRAPAISYRSHPDQSTEALQGALADFVLQRTRELRNGGPVRAACVAIGAPVNAHDKTVLGSGPLWGPTAKPFQLSSLLFETMPDVEWHIVNDVTALLAPYMEDGTSFRKTLLITVSTGIGSRLYDHVTHRIPYDGTHGVQGEIGHLAMTFDLDGNLVRRQCECGGWNHLNAFASGRGVAGVLRELPILSARLCAALDDSPQHWQQQSDEYRSSAFNAALDEHNPAAIEVLDALVTPLCRVLATGLSLDPEIERIVVTGGVARGLGRHYKEALCGAFLRDGLYQITGRDPDYLARRLHWEDLDDFSGLRGAGIYARVV